MKLVAISMAMFVVVAVGGTARADLRHRDRVEVTFGFLGGQRSYAHQSFAFDEGDASPALATPFVGAPFDGVRVLGFGFDMRVSMRGVRAAYGREFPYPEISPDIMLATASAVPARVRSLETSEHRLSVGYEFVLDRITAYADVIGTAYHASAKVVVGELQSTYSTQGFGFSTRAGLQVPITKYYFVYGHGEVGLTGHVLWAAHIGLGFNLGS